MRKIAAVVVSLVFISACAAVIGIKDLIPGAETDGGGDDDALANGQDGSHTDGTTTSDSPTSPTDANADVDANCGDTTASADNCGRCGHSCLGGKCSASVCQPTAIATGQGMVGGVALDNTFVYFTSISNNVVARVPKIGGDVAVLAQAPDVSLAKHLAVNATHVYWGNADCCSGAVMRCPIAGCVGAAEVVAVGEEPLGIALDTTYVYWADRNASKIERKPISDAGGARQLIAITQGAVPESVTVGSSGDGLAFWIGDFSGEVDRGNNPPDGGSITIGANGQSGRDLTLDNGFVYWGAAIDPGDPGRISRAPKSGVGPSQTIGPAQGEPMGIVVDGALVYWTADVDPADGGGVYACNIGGCANPTPQLIAGGQDTPRGIAIDETAIYWGVNGFVMKLAKP